jgi:hypothetical protein
MKRFTKAEQASWPEGHKGCTVCLGVLPFDEFYAKAKGAFGLNAWCKECHRRKTRKNPERSFKRHSAEEIASWPEGCKVCNRCHEVLPLESFDAHSSALFGRYPTCKDCRKPGSKALWAGVPDERRILQRTKSRAAAKGIPFDLVLEDIVIPEVCPVLGVPLVRGEKDSDYAPSIDRMDPAKGYVQGNVVIISGRANRIKSNATSTEVARVAEWMAAQGL